MADILLAPTADMGEPPTVIGEPDPPPFYAGITADALRLLQDAVALLQAQVLALQGEIEALKLSDQQQHQTIEYLGVAIEYLPCPHNKCSGLPDDGWTGKPIDAPDAVVLTVEQCMNSGSCDCETGAALQLAASPAVV